MRVIRTVLLGCALLTATSLTTRAQVMPTGFTASAYNGFAIGNIKTTEITGVSGTFDLVGTDILYSPLLAVRAGTNSAGARTYVLTVQAYTALSPSNSGYIGVLIDWGTIGYYDLGVAISFTATSGSVTYTEQTFTPSTSTSLNSTSLASNTTGFNVSSLQTISSGTFTFPSASGTYANSAIGIQVTNATNPGYLGNSTVGNQGNGSFISFAIPAGSGSVPATLPTLDTTSKFTVFAGSGTTTIFTSGSVLNSLNDAIGFGTGNLNGYTLQYVPEPGTYVGLAGMLIPGLYLVIRRRRPTSN